ncbi:HAD family hydrolase [Plantactinospora siamensis]|uniref:HAD family hydrolase n=1 Tax=Plantactinospora siamensis TaxID=555372 RepID=A0ABV6P306_9ACTN
MSRPRLVASDLDGTLLDTASMLTDRTRAALRLARSAGARVVAATARPPRIVALLFGGHEGGEDGDIREAVAGSRDADSRDGRRAGADGGTERSAGPLIDAAVCVNGAVRYDLASGRVDIRHPLDRDLAARVIDEVHRRIPGSGIAVETGERVFFDRGYRYRPTLDRNRILVDSTAELLAEPLVKLMVSLPDRNPEAAWALLRPILGGRVACTWAELTAPLEIAAPAVSKAGGLAELCADWHIDPAEVLAFGDGPNDLSMLDWAGTAYAVANAHPAVLAATVNHTAGNGDDGVARILEKLYG